MNLEHRIHLLSELGNYCLSEDAGWKEAQHRAHLENGWFIPEFIEEAVRQIGSEYLQKDKLAQWARGYGLPQEQTAPRTVGLIMAGNLPLVGFHDFLSIFISGHRQLIKPSSRDEVLIRRLVAELIRLDPEVASYVGFAERLKGCDAYIATGSNNSARYFDYYFARYPHIIRRNRSSVAILSGQETKEQLEGLAKDVYLYFGLGCRNVTKLYVPENYDFVPLLDAFRSYDYLADYAKYKHNYDYQLTILLLNKKYYMTNGTILLAENSAIFTPISVLNYEFYQPASGSPGQGARPLPNPESTGSAAAMAHPQPVIAPSPASESTGSPASAPAGSAVTPPLPAPESTGPAAAIPAPQQNAPGLNGSSPHSYPAYLPTAGPAVHLAAADLADLAANSDIQCIVGEGGIPFGQAQHPALNDYADGVDTLQFLRDL